MICPPDWYSPESRWRWGPSKLCLTLSRENANVQEVTEMVVEVKSVTNQQLVWNLEPDEVRRVTPHPAPLPQQAGHQHLLGLEPAEGLGEPEHGPSGVGDVLHHHHRGPPQLARLLDALDRLRTRTCRLHFDEVKTNLD